MHADMSLRRAALELRSLPGIACCSEAHKRLLHASTAPQVRTPRRAPLAVLSLRVTQAVALSAEHSSDRVESKPVA